MRIRPRDVEPPLVKGGQGRSDEEVYENGMTALVIAGLIILAGLIYLIGYGAGAW